MLRDSIAATAVSRARTWLDSDSLDGSDTQELAASKARQAPKTERRPVVRTTSVTTLSQSNPGGVQKNELRVPHDVEGISA